MIVSPPTSRTASRTVIAWQGWRLDVPDGWNPIQINGRYENGRILLADLHHPRLAIRWQTIASKRFDPDAWATHTMIAEVGKLAAAEATPLELPGWSASRVYRDPNPPGRDVWLAYSCTSRRAIEVIHHARRRERMFVEQILPAVRDLPADQPMPWAVFELSCLAPAGMKLQKHQLDAGDLSLTFAALGQYASVRQVAVAHLALRRRSIDQWLQDHHARVRSTFRPAGPIYDGEHGRMQKLVRRRVWHRSLPRELLSCLQHDESRDRLVFVQANDNAALRQLLNSIGRSM